MYFSFKFSMYFARICTRFIERQAGIDRNNDILIETKLESEMANCENGLVSEGKELQDVACSHGLKQIVKAPTRDRYLPDLIPTDCDFISAAAVPGFSDHLGTKVTIKFALPEQDVVERFCFNYRTGTLSTKIRAK